MEALLHHNVLRSLTPSFFFSFFSFSFYFNTVWKAAEAGDMNHLSASQEHVPYTEVVQKSELIGCRLKSNS